MDTREIKVYAGDFQRFGCVLHGKRAVFTFEIGKEPKLLLYRRSDETLISEIPVPKEYCIGRVASLTVTGPDWKDTAYLLSNNGRLAVDPYASLIYGRERWNDTGRKEKNYRTFSGACYREFHWENDRVNAGKCGSESNDVMLHLHLRGFTMQTGLSKSKRGNYLGIISRLSKLQEYGITILEFQPLYEFEEIRFSTKEIIGSNQKKSMSFGEPEGVNYWGYGKAEYFAPKSSYFGGTDPDIHMKEMIKAIHSHGMKILMEFSFDTSCSEHFILSCLQYWNREYHIDGFRLVGTGLPLKQIAADPFLSNVMILTDKIPADILADEKKEYRHFYLQNSDFQFPVRKLQNHMEGSIIDFANMMKRQNESYGFVNYAASAFGFTLLDAYSYSEKHNEANGEDNRDGSNYNYSHNYGVEGPTNSRNVMTERLRHVRTALAAVLMGQGIPMIEAGDTWGNTQYGNNNAYCQDNPVGWTFFSQKKVFRDLHDYIARLIRFRGEHPVLSGRKPKEMADYLHVGLPDLSYHGKEPWTPWLSNDRKSIGILYSGDYGEQPEEDIYLCFNFYFDEEPFSLPKLLHNRSWHYITNTGLADWEEEPPLLEDQETAWVPGGSLTILTGFSENEIEKADKNGTEETD